MASKMDNWDVGDYCEHFHRESRRSDDETFRAKFDTLASELGSLDAEFLRGEAGCGEDLSKLLDKLHSLAGRLGYCETPRDLEKTCEALYSDADQALEQAKALNRACFE